MDMSRHFWATFSSNRFLANDVINELNILLWYFCIGNMTDGILQRGSIELPILCTL